MLEVSYKTIVQILFSHTVYTAWAVSMIRCQSCDYLPDDYLAWLGTHADCTSSLEFTGHAYGCIYVL